LHGNLVQADTLRTIDATERRGSLLELTIKTKSKVGPAYLYITDVPKKLGWNLQYRATEFA
jgi:hypothetical protein